MSRDPVGVGGAVNADERLGRPTRLSTHGYAWSVELQTFKILAAERLRLIKMGIRLIADYFQHTVNILKW